MLFEYKWHSNDTLLFVFLPSVLFVRIKLNAVDPTKADT